METVRQKVRHRRRGEPFTAKEMSSLGNRASVDQALSRLVKDRVIERVGRGVYVRPKESPLLGRLPVSAVQVAKAVARARQEKLQLSGAEAANRLGLTTQVPARTIYLTDGPSRIIRVGKQEVELKHAASTKLVGAGTEGGLVISALYYLGREAVTPEVIGKLQGSLSFVIKNQLLRLLPHVPSWMGQSLRAICQE
ncbi:MAG: hypothetical protein AMXMBFR33_17780 [Candidatus Xenobia bacterium]